MFPTVGLYLPNTVQGNMLAASPKKSSKARSEVQQDNKLQLAGRDSTDKISLARKSSEDISKSRSNAFASISTAFHFADFVSKLNDASSEIQSLVTVIERVRKDIYTALWLRESHLIVDYCERWPDNQVWIDNILQEVQAALNDIGIYVENVQVSSKNDETGAVKLRHQFDWVLRYHHKVRDRQNTLIVCHQSLSMALNLMQMVQMNGSIQAVGGETGGDMPLVYQAPATPWMQHEDEQKDVLRGPYMRHKTRLSERNLSTPSITVSQFERSQEDRMSESYRWSTEQQLTSYSQNIEP